jgi:RHS repeat-associated protein
VIDAAANRLIYGRRFLYDGWNLIAEYALNASLSTLTLVRTYTWGLDIARTMSDAGGVGALLQITDHGTGRSFLPAYDGNGNVTALLNSSETTRIVNGVSTTYPAGSVAAAYEYSPFGEQLRADAPDSVVADQPFRFSTKYTDSETGLVYYGQRYYDPAQGRFVGRDPIEEKGGINLYAFVRNRPVNTVDVMGLLGLDDAVVLHADGGGSFDPIIRMNPFVTAVDSEQRIQRALDALAAQSNPFIFAFNAGLGGSGGQKSDEQKKKEEEEKKKKEECEKMMKNLQGKMRQSTALHSDLQDQIKMEQFGELVSTAHMVVSEGLKAGLGTAMSLKLGRVFVAQRAVPWTAMNGARMGGDYATVTNGGLLNEMVRNAGLEVIGDRVVDPLVTGATLGALGAFWNEYGDALESGKDAMAVARQVTDRLQSSYNKLMSDVGKLQDDYQSKCP